MAEGGTHRIGSAALTFWAPRAAPQTQAAADRAARTARTRLAGAIAARVPADTRHVIVDRLDLPSIAIPLGTDPVDAVGAEIAAKLGRLTPGQGVWIFDSEVAYVAAFITALASGRNPTGRLWTGLRGRVGEPPAQAIMRLCQARRLDPLSVLAELSARGALVQVLATTSPDALAELERQCMARSRHPDVGSDILLAAARSVLATVGVTAPIADTLKAALSALPVSWSSPTSLADAVGRAILMGGWPGVAAKAWSSPTGPVKHRPLGTSAPDPTSAPTRLPAETDAAIKSLHWLDVSRLRRILSDPQQPQASVEFTRTIRDLEEALSTAAEDIAASRSDSAAQILWRAAWRQLDGAGSDDLIAGLIARVVDPGDTVHPHLISLHALWQAVRGRVPANDVDASDPKQPRASVEFTRTIRDLEEALSTAAEDIAASRSDSAAQILWRAAWRQLDGAGSDDLIAGLIARVVDPGDMVHPHLISLHALWQTVRGRVPANDVDASAPSASAGPPPAAGVSSARQLDASKQPQTVRPSANLGAAIPQDVEPSAAAFAEGNTAGAFSTRIETEAAGLFLLWRTLNDLSFAARAREVSDADGFASGALWTIWRDETDQPLDEAAGLLFAGLPTKTRPNRISDTEAQRLTAKLARAPGLAHRSRPAKGLNTTLIAGMTCWLRGFEGSSAAFMRRSFLHRPGALLVGKTALEVRLSPLPFDLVLRRAGYLDPLSAPDCVGGYRTRFKIEESP